MRPVRVIMDPDLGRYPMVWAAAGLPTAVFPVPPATLRMLADAHGRPDRRGAAGRETIRQPQAPTGSTRPPTAADDAPSRATRPSPTPAGCAPAGAGAAAARAPAVFALSEAGGTLIDLGAARRGRSRCRCAGPSSGSRVRAARGRPASPRRSTTSRRRCYWDTAGLLVVEYGFHAYGLDARPATRAGSTARRRRSSPCSGRRGCAHVVVQAELETFAIEPDGTVAWRIAHSDVVTAAELVGGRLVLTELRRPGQRARPATGRAAAERARHAVARCGRPVDNRGRSRQNLVDSRHCPARPARPTVDPSPEGPSDTNGGDRINAHVSGRFLRAFSLSARYHPAVTPLLLVLAGLVALAVGVARAAVVRAALPRRSAARRRRRRCPSPRPSAGRVGRRRATSGSPAGSTPTPDFEDDAHRPLVFCAGRGSSSATGRDWRRSTISARRCRSRSARASTASRSIDADPRRGPRRHARANRSGPRATSPTARRRDRPDRRSGCASSRSRRSSTPSSSASRPTPRARPDRRRSRPAAGAHDPRAR